MTPPPKAMRRESRSAPDVASCWARDSTLAMRLWRSPAGRKRTGGGSLKLARTDFDQSAQISGDVTMKGLKGLFLLSFSMRGRRVLSRPEAMVTS